MSDRHFREDENELPYLVREVRDDDSTSYTSPLIHETNEEKLDRILQNIPIPDFRRKILKNKIVSFLNAKDCTNLTVDTSGYGEYSFFFTRENRYIKTVDEFYYNVELENDRRIFWDCYTRHEYDNLIRSPEFKSLVKRTGMEFVRCGGGYETDYSMADDEFSFRDEINLRVYLKAGSSEKVYELDLERMEFK